MCVERRLVDETNEMTNKSLVPSSCLSSSWLITGYLHNFFEKKNLLRVLVCDIQTENETKSSYTAHA